MCLPEQERKTALRPLSVKQEVKVSLRMILLKFTWKGVEYPSRLADFFICIYFCTYRNISYIYIYIVILFIFLRVSQLITKSLLLKSHRCLLSFASFVLFTLRSSSTFLKAKCSLPNFLHCRNRRLTTTFRRTCCWWNFEVSLWLRSPRANRRGRRRSALPRTSSVSARCVEEPACIADQDWRK